MLRCCSCSVKFKICIGVSSSMIRSNPWSFNSSISFSRFKMVSCGPSSVFPSYSVISLEEEDSSLKSSKSNAPNRLTQSLIYNCPIFLLNISSCILHLSSSNPSSTCNMFIIIRCSTSISIWVRYKPFWRHSPHPQLLLFWWGNPIQGANHSYQCPPQGKSFDIWFLPLSLEAQ